MILFLLLLHWKIWIPELHWFSHFNILSNELGRHVFHHEGCQLHELYDWMGELFLENCPSLRSEAVIHSNSGKKLGGVANCSLVCSLGAAWLIEQLSLCSMTHQKCENYHIMFYGSFIIENRDKSYVFDFVSILAWFFTFPLRETIWKRISWFFHAAIEFNTSEVKAFEALAMECNSWQLLSWTFTYIER